jgi:hypothetical protein
MRAEAEALMRTYPVDPKDGWAEVPTDRLPPTIASLKPEFVSVSHGGVSITTKAYFDGGWGYEIGSGKQALAMPPACLDEVYPNVFWHGPC